MESTETAARTSIITYCRDCGSQGINLPDVKECGNCGSNNTRNSKDEFQSNTKAVPNFFEQSNPQDEKLIQENAWLLSEVQRLSFMMRYALEAPDDTEIMKSILFDALNGCAGAENLQEVRSLHGSYRDYLRQCEALREVWMIGDY